MKTAEEEVWETTLPVFMPDGRVCPGVLTADEVVAFLRLEGNGLRALKYYRDQGQLVGIRLGRRVRYPLSEIMRFLAQKTRESKSACFASRS